LLPEHHGIGVRMDDFIGCKQYSGILVKEYQAVYAKGDKDAAKQSKQSQKEYSAMKKGEGYQYKEKEKKPVKEKKEKKGLFGSKKKEKK